MTRSHKYFFLIVAILSLLLRFWKLSDLPVSLNWDEVSHGYNAYSILQTGSDQWNKPFPIFNFRAYGDYPTVLNMYLTIPFVKIFGLNSLSIRLPTAILGFLTVIYSYFLTLEITKNRKTSLLTMFLMAISPWSLFPSRAVFQSTVAQFFIVSGIYYLLKAKYLSSAILLGLSLYSYHNARIFVPILIAFYIILNFSNFKGKHFSKSFWPVFSLIVFLLMFIPNLINIFTPESSARSRWVFILNQDAINYIENQRNANGNTLLSKIRYNRPFYFFQKVGQNYLNFVNPIPLFFSGTQNYQFNVPGWGIMYSLCLPFFYLGIYYCFSSKDIAKKTKLMIFGWFLIGLIPSVITSGDFQNIRSMSILPIPFIFIAMALSRSKTILPIFLTLLIIQSSIYFYNYINIYPKKHSLSWQYGYEEAVEYIRPLYSNYSQILFTKKYGEPHEFILFYWPWNPSSYQNDLKLEWNMHSDWYWVDGFDKFKFINDWDIKSTSSNPSSSTLLITSPNNFPTSYKHLTTIYSPNGSAIFEILSYEK